MSQEPEKIKKLIAFKKKMERRVEELESKLEEQQSILELVDSILLERGFKRAEITEELSTPQVPTTPEPATKHEKTIQLKTGTGELLANLRVNQNSMRVIPAEDKNFSIDTPPFTQFLVERVLDKMKEKDNELAKAGKLPQEEVFSYKIVQDGDKIREITIKNFDDKRLKELKSSTRWTLEKMYEKTEN